MPICRICQHIFKSLRFETKHIGICTRCANTLNNNPEPAQNAEARFAEKLAHGMQRNAERDLHADEEWKRQKAKKILADMDTAVAAALHDWITRLLEKPENNTRDFKIMRAYRRRLLREQGFTDKPEGWIEVARRIRHRDGYKCASCSASDTTLDVHHIIHLSNYGTNQQSNLITLCRKCHEAEHKRVFDWPDAKDAEQPAPIPPSPDSPAPTYPPEPRTKLHCPICLAKLANSSNMALPGKAGRCPNCTLTIGPRRTL